MLIEENAFMNIDSIIEKQFNSEESKREIKETRFLSQSYQVKK